MIKRLKDGERGRNRTYNLLIKSQLLCQLSYAPTRGVLLAGQFVIVTSPSCRVIAIEEGRTRSRLRNDRRKFGK
jgi:hypothetical protein